MLKIFCLEIGQVNQPPNRLSVDGINIILFQIFLMHHNNTLKALT